MDGIKDGSLGVCLCRDATDEESAGTDLGVLSEAERGAVSGGEVDSPCWGCRACCGDRLDEPEVRRF